MANHPVFGNITNISRNFVEKNDAKRRNRNLRLKVSQGTNLATQGNLPDDKTERVDGAENVISVNPNLTYPLCEANHWLTRCHLFKGKSYEERYKFVREKGLCDNCLQSGHVASTCPKQSFCQVSNCKLKHRKHATFLHPKREQPERPEHQSISSTSGTASNEPNVRAQNSFVGVSEGPCGSTGAGAPSIGLAVVPVKVKAKGKGAVIETYAFLDPGSNTSFCTDQLIERLGATGTKTTLSLTTMSDKDAKSQSLVVCLEISNLCGNHTIELPNVFSRPSLPITVDDIPRQTDVDRWAYLQSIHVPHIDAEIELLIGNDAPNVLEPKEIRESKDGGPYAVRTLFGWTINGPLGRMSSSSSTTNRIQSSADLSTQFEKFCEMEFNDSQFTVEKTLSQEDKTALHTMEQSVRLRDGHYEVALPWKVFPPNLPNNKTQAEQRLLSLKKRLVRNPELHQKYSAFMEDLVEKGYARRVPEDQEIKPSWYLPHYPVIHPHKPSKVRVVFDCAVRFQGASLNERILQGPDLTNTLIGVLSRFRQESTAVMPDVEQMFYQQLVPVKDCNFLRCLWWPGGDFESAPQEFQMRVHVFGCLLPKLCQLTVEKSSH